MKRTIHWVCPAPSPFHEHFFRAVADEADLDLLVHFERGHFAQHPWKSRALSGFKYRAFAPRFGIDWKLVWLTLREKDALLLLPGWSDPTTRLVSAFARAPFAIWTDTPQVDAYRPPVKRALRALWSRWIFRRARFVLGTGSPGVGALERMRAPKDKLVNLPFFVPVAPEAERANRAAPAPGEPVRFCSLGRLINSYKGYDVALNALAAARDAVGHENFRYTIGGTGQDQDALRRQAESLGLAHLVEFAGWLEPEETTALLRGSHALLHPARWDAFPVAVLDAMANGVVVLGSDAAGSVRDRVVSGSNGFVHHAGDVAQLADQIATVLRAPNMLPELGRRAWETAGEWPVARGVNVIRELLARSAA